MALQMTWQPNLQRRKSGAPPLGLRNLGNTCYLNSVLQCLTYTPPLANFCLRGQHTRLCKKLDGDDNKRECPFCILEKRISRSLSIDGPHDAPSKIESCLRLFAEHFQWGRQEDAHEFLRYVIDACQNTCLKLLKAAASNSDSMDTDKDRSGGRESNTVVREIFGGALLSQVKCLSCNAESNKTDEIMDISLDLYQSNSLSDALRRFFQPEILNGSNKYCCNSCKKLSEARKQIFVLEAPNVLVIQLKRFEGVYGAKINKDIAFEEALLLSSFMCKASQDPHPEYNLFGSIVHSGYSPESGHYYAYIKDATGRWYCCNDAYVSLSTAQAVLSEKVYILFYVRSNQKPKDTKTGLATNGLKSLEPNGSSAPLNHKPYVSSRQLSVKQNGMHLTLPKSASTNGNCALPMRNGSASIILKPSANGALHPEKETAVLRNDKILSKSPMKFSNLKNVELKRAARKNENDNPNAHGIEAVKTNSSSGHSKAMKETASSPTFKSNWKSAAAHGREELGHSFANNSEGHSSDSTERVTKSGGTVSNGNGCIKLMKCETTDDNDAALISPVTSGTHASHSQAVESCKPGVSSVCKRKAENRTVGNSRAFDSPGEDVPTRKCRANADKYFPGGLEKYKEVIAVEASFKLRSCGWADEVHDFMRAQKRLCTEVADSNRSDKTELKKLLIADAKKAFTSRLPNSIRQSLIERLKLFSLGKSLPDES